jgi:nicotinate-nucleotide adenylyltransferase
MRIAFFGGTFDPPHQGHLGLARAAQQTLNLDKILFAPVGLQPLKPTGSSASFEDRVAMTQLAIAGQPNFELSLADAPAASSNTPNYTAETLTRLRQSLPSETELYLLLGADSLRTLPQWHRAPEIPFLANLIVAARPGHDISNFSISDLAACLPSGIAIAIANLPTQPNHYRLVNAAGQQSQLILLPDTHYEISATQFRNQIHDNPSTLPALIPEPVLQYIHQHHLYK